MSENTWLVWPLVPAQVGKGVHVVGIDPRLRPPIVVRWQLPFQIIAY